MNKQMFFVVSILVCCLVNCSSPSMQSVSAQGLTEEDAVNKVAEDIYSKIDILKEKKVAIFYFSNLEGKETNDGIRLSKKLLEALINKGGIIFIERSELDKILNAQGIEQTGIVDTDTFSITGKVIPIDVMINGTLAQISGNGEISVKTVNIGTGQIYALSTVAFVPKEKFTYQENADNLKLHKSSPEKLESINKTYRVLNLLNRKFPAIYMLAVLEEQDIPKIKQNNPGLAMKLKQISDSMKKDRPGDWKKILVLRKGTQLIKQYAPARYKEIIEKKNTIIESKAQK